MADFDTLGKALQIPDNVIKNIDAIDKKINQIATDSEKMATAFQSAMTRMNGITGDLIKKLQTIHGLVGGIGNINIGGLNNVNNGLGKTTTEAEKVANAVTEAAIALNRFSKTWQELGGRPQVSKSFEILTNREQLNVLKEARNEADAYSRALSEANKKNIAETKVAANAIKEQSQTEKNRHEEKMARLKQEASSVRINSSAYRDYVSAITMSEGTENSRIKKIERMNTVLSELQRKEALYANEIEIVRKKIEQLTRENDSLARSREKTKKQNIDERANTQALNAYNRAMAASDALVTQRINKIAKLRQAEEMLRNASGNYATQLNRISQEIARLNKLNQGQVDSYGRVIRSQHNLMNTSQQLARQLALVFSVSAIEGYVTKLIRVRGEFELQQTALASILQNKDQADKLFGQITELAVRSPFSLRELNQYTKSLAAYQVQYEDLYETTKMLADVSSGLGVGMDRLILAFGQVKAANFLRGTEVRQFTEAGLNILGELAKYYSELEGRMVSVGEVQEMVTKRMVSFGDVEEIFKRVTSAGGMFYNMQERQAETLAGQWTNLTDSIDVMFNEIGTANDGTLKNMVALIRSLIENWEEVVYTVKPAIIALGAYKAATILAKISTSQFAVSLRTMTTGIYASSAGMRVLSKAMISLRAVSQGLMATLIALVPVALIGGLIEITRRLTQASREAQRFNESIREITNEGTLRASELSAGFERLADNAVQAADGSREQKQALDELSRTYSGIIPQDDLKIEKLREMKGAYESVTTAIYNKIEADTKEKKIQAVNTTYGTKAMEALDALARRLTQFSISNENARVIVEEFRKGIESGDITEDNAYSQLTEIVKEYTNEVVTLQETTYKSIDPQTQLTRAVTKEIPEIKKATDAMSLWDNKLKEVTETNYKGFRLGGGSKIYDELHKQLQDVDKIKEEWEKSNKNKFEFTIEFSEEAKKTQIKAYEKFIADINEKIKSGEIKPDDVVSAQLVIEETQNAIDKLNVSPMVSQVNKVRLEFSKLTGIDFGKLNFTEMSATEGFDEYIKGLNSVIKGYEDAIKVFDEARVAGQEVPLMQRESLLQGMESEEELRKRAEAVKAFRDAIYYEPPKTTTTGGGGSKNPELDKLKEQLKIIQQVEQAYRKYREYMTKEEASSMAKQLAVGTVAEKVVGTLSLDTSELIEGLEKFSEEAAKKAGEEGQKAVDEVIRDYKEKNIIEIEVKGIEAAKKRVSSIFQSYEFSLDLDTKGIDASAFRNMLKSVGATDAEISFMGLNTTTFKEAQQQLRDEIIKLQQEGGDKQLEEAQKIQKQLTDLEIREATKRYDELLTLREKYQSTEKKISDLEGKILGWNIEIDAIKTIQEIDGIGDKFEATQKEYLELQVQNAKDMILQLKSEALQLTEFWQNLFGDLGELSLNSIKDIMRQRDEIIANATPIKNSQGETSGYSSSFIDSQGTEQQVQMTIGQYNQLIKAYQKLKDEYRQRNPLGNFVNSIIEGRKEGESFRDFTTRLTKDFDELATEAFEVANSILEISNASDEAMQKLQGAESIVKGFISVSEGIASENPLAVFSGLVSVIGGISKIHDSNREQEIKNELEAVNELERAYSNLQYTIESGLSIDAYNMQSQVINNLMKQIKSYQAMIEAERDKKNTDQDRIDEWKDKINSLYQEISDTYRELTTQLIGDFKSMAQTLGDSLVEALKRGEDAGVAFGDTMKDVFLQVLQNAFQMSVLEPLMEDLTNQINEMERPKASKAEEQKQKVQELENELNSLENRLDNSGFNILQRVQLFEQIELKEKELAKAQEKYNQLLKDSAGEGIRVPSYEEIKSKLEEVMGSEQGVLASEWWKLIEQFIGEYFPKEAQGDNLTSLQKGIQGLSEQTGQALEALCESIRYFTSDSNTVLHNFYNAFVMPTDENPFLAELRVQSEQLRMLNSVLNSVVKSVPSSGKAIKVQIV